MIRRPADGPNVLPNLAKDLEDTYRQLTCDSFSGSSLDSPLILAADTLLILTAVPTTFARATCSF
jgi:hypothetical protein